MKVISKSYFEELHTRILPAHDPEVGGDESKPASGQIRLFKLNNCLILRCFPLLNKLHTPWGGNG